MTGTDVAAAAGSADTRRVLHQLVGLPDRRPAVRLSALLAVAAVASQLVYPRVVEERDALTVVNVVLFSGASLTHAAAVHGLRTALRAALVFVGGGLLVEVLGVATGFPFGTYAYADRLGPMVAEVPLLIPLAWSMLGWPALVVARRITAHRVLGPAVGAVALATWDLFLDPQMVAEGYWTWGGDGPHLIGTIPATNYLAWLGTSWLMMLAMWSATRRWAPGRDDRVPVALYVWTWLGSIVAHAVFFDLPQSALYGGLGMGLVVALLLGVVAVRAGGPGEDGGPAA